jgi:hypothetical protein
MPYEQTFGARPASDRSSAAAPDLVSDAAAAIAAVGRMEATIRSDRAAFLRLRAEAQTMAKAIADAKATLQAWAIKPDAAPGGKATELAALLLDLESRLNAMQFLMDFVCDGGADAPARELDHVPTVSDVVSRLGRGGEAAAEDRDAAQPKPGFDEVPSVSMLGALVEALNASISATEPESIASAASQLSAMEQTPAEMPAEPMAAAALPVRPAATIPTVPEGDLLDSFARMKAIPILAPDIGTAVIFACLAETTPPADRQPDRAVPQPAPTAVQPEPVAAPDTAPAPHQHEPPDQRAAAAATPPHDPLAAPNAMSPEEQIALTG